ncbi:hypothetical protein A2W24_00330 [Microgenomates group bacterium RBG_16_45_19]|nr:MAG: hypothetical protein A2W24_00330 [Microgenomates group bacterium RBG_16_45_19]
MPQKCQTCSKAFKLITQELAFYKRMGLPLPTNCPDCRHQRRLSLRNERQFYKYLCAKCGQSMVTTVNPDKGMIVYCLKCYEEFRSQVDLTKVV